MIGELVGSYRVTAKLGEGGMGVVYAAEHEVMGRAAVVKVLRRQLSGDKEIVKRFFNEARAAASIRHPGIVDVYDVGFHTDGSAFIVMDRLDGESLQQRLTRVGRLGVAEAVSLTRQVLGALGEAHQKGIVHRDLKPDNVFIVRDPEVPSGERAKILDFGIAKLQDDTAAHGVATQTGTLMGTPLYMSPEQCRGAGEVDHRTDLYAVGCMLFQLLAGRPPFLGDSPGELYAAHIRDAPPPLTDFVTDLPAGVDAVVRALLAKAPAQRFASSRAAITALDSATGGAFSSSSALPRVGAAPQPGAATDPLAATVMGTDAPASLPATKVAAPVTTTLGGAAAEVAPHTVAPSRSPIVPIVLGLAAIAAAAAVAIVVLRDGASSAPRPAARASLADLPAELEGVPPIDFTPVSDGRTSEARKGNNRALELHRAADYAGAVELYKAAVRSDPGYLLARYNLACAYNMAGQRDNGLAILLQFKRAGCPVCLGRLIRARSDGEWKSARDDARFQAITGDVLLEQPATFEMAERFTEAVRAGGYEGIRDFFDPRDRVELKVGEATKKVNGFSDVAHWLTEQPASIAAGAYKCRGDCCAFVAVDGAAIQVAQFCTEVDSGSVRLITSVELAGPAAAL